MLDKVLHLIIITWEGEQKSFSANMMNGVARLIYAYGSEIEEEVFKEKLGVISIKEISKVAKERRAGFLGYAEAMLIFYSKRMKNPHSWKALYMNKHDKDRHVLRMLPQAEQKTPKQEQSATEKIAKIQAG